MEEGLEGKATEQCGSADANRKKKDKQVERAKERRGERMCVSVSGIRNVPKVGGLRGDDIQDGVDEEAARIERRVGASTVKAR